MWTSILKGFAEGEMGEFELAEADFERASKLGLDDAAHYVMLVNRGVMRVRRGRMPNPRSSDFQAAIALKPDQFQAYINLAQVDQNLHRFDQALELLDRAIARFPKQAVLYRTRARVHRLLSHRPESLGDLDRAIALAHARRSGAGRRPSGAGADLPAGRETRRGTGRVRSGPGDPARPPRRPAGPGRRAREAQAIRRRNPIVRRLPGRGDAVGVAVRSPGPGAVRICGSYERAIADYTLALGTGRATASLFSHRGWAYLFSGAPAPRCMTSTRRCDSILPRRPRLSGRAPGERPAAQGPRGRRRCPSLRNGQSPRIHD